MSTILSKENYNNLSEEEKKVFDLIDKTVEIYIKKEKESEKYAK